MIVLRKSPFLLLLLSAAVNGLLISSCRKKEQTIGALQLTDTVYVHDSVKNIWKEDPVNGFLGNLYIMNAGKQGQFLSFVTSNGNKMSADSTAKSFGDVSIFPYTSSNHNLFYYPEMKSGVCVTAIENDLTISGIVPRNSGMENDFYCNLKRFDSTFSALTGCDFPSIKNSVIADGNSVLLPVITTNTANNTIYRFNYKVEYLTGAGNGFANVPLKTDTTSTSRIEIPITNTTTPYRYIYPCGNIGQRAFFYLEANRGTYLISEDNSYTKVCDDCLCQFFRHDQIDYALGYNNNKLYATTNSGNSWYVAFTLTEQNVRIFEFDNRLIALSGGNIYEVIFQPQKIEFKKLVTTGLENRGVTSLNRFAGRVYASTNGGMYSCDYSKFYTYAN